MVRDCESTGSGGASNPVSVLNEVEVELKLSTHAQWVRFPHSMSLTAQVGGGNRSQTSQAIAFPRPAGGFTQARRKLQHYSWRNRYRRHRRVLAEG